VLAGGVGFSSEGASGLITLPLVAHERSGHKIRFSARANLRIVRV
jgi:hypothetical protein